MAKKTKNVRWTTVVPSQEEQYDLKRRALIREAGKAFSRKGFHNTSMNDVAEVLNVTKPALYYYVETKQEVLYECHALALDLGEQARSYAWSKSEKPLERLSLLITRYIELLTGSFGSYAALLEPLSSLEPQYREKIRVRLREFDKVFLELVRDAVADGSLPPIDPKLAVGFFMGAINNISRWFSPTGRCSGPEIAEAFCGFVLDGLRGSKKVANEEVIARKPRRSRKVGQVKPSRIKYPDPPVQLRKGR